MDMVDCSIGFYFSCRNFPLHRHRAYFSGGGENVTSSASSANSDISDISALIILCCVWQAGHQSL